MNTTTPTPTRTNRYAAQCTRAAVTLQLGRPLAAGEMVLHSCDNPPCFNLDHLRVGTARENSADMMSRGRGRGQVVAVPLEVRVCVICEAEHQRKPYDLAVTCSASCRTRLGHQRRS